MPHAQVSTLEVTPDCIISGAAPPQTPIEIVLNDTKLLYKIIAHLPNSGHIQSVNRVSKSWRLASVRALEHLFHINALLAPYFSDVIAFRRLQCELDIIISGSFALSIFRPHDGKGNPTMGAASDMDIFVEWTLADELERFLAADGYDLRTRFENPLPVAVNTPQGVSIPDDSFERVMRFKRGDRFIDVVCTTATPVYCIFRFHSTIVMNFVTWNCAYSMFPYDTLIKDRGLVLRVNNDRTRRAVQKYAIRGFEMIEWREGPPNVFAGSLRPRYRWVGDDRCWRVDLDITRVITDVDPGTGLADDMAVESDYTYSFNGFMLAYEQAAGPTMKAEDKVWCPVQDCDILVHKSLLYSYAAGKTFYEQVFRYLRRRAQLDGDSYRRQGDMEKDLQHVKTEFMKRFNDSTAIPCPLYG